MVQVTFTEGTCHHSSSIQLLSGWSLGDSVQVMEFPGGGDMITLHMKARNCSPLVARIKFVSAYKGEVPECSRSNGSDNNIEKCPINTGRLEKEGERAKSP